MEKSDINDPTSNKNFATVANNSINKDFNIQNSCTKEDIPLLKNDNGPNKCSRFLNFLTTLTIEPAAFFFLFAYIMNASCLSNLIMDKGCLYYFNYTKEICLNLSGHEDQKENVEKLANNYLLYLNLLSLIAACMMVFIAPWSEKHGRKLPIIITCFGSIVSDIGIIMCVVFYESSLNYLILCRLPTEILGGFICFLTIIYSHAAEVTTEKGRFLKYVTVEIAFMLALSTGGLAGGLILQYFGYFYVYLTSLVLHILSAIWVFFVVEETAGEGVNASWVVKRKNFFRLDSILKSTTSVMKARENKKRLMIWMYLASMCVVVLTYEMFGSLGYIFVHHIYNWNPAQYNAVNTAFSLTSFAVMMVVAPILIKRLQLQDSMLGMIGSLSMMAKNVFIAFATYDVIVYYIGNASGFLVGFAPLAIRTGLSKMTDKEELGLVFSFLATCEAIFPMFGTTLATRLFNATMNIVPSVVYLVAVALLTIPLGTFMWIYTRSRNGKYLPTTNDN